MLNVYNTTCFAYEYDYMGLVIFFLISTVLAFVLLILSFILSPKEIYAEKLSAYECGFEPFDEARKTFDVHFYIVAILFIIFDLEVAFLFPWAVSLNKIGIFGFWVMMIFVFILTLGFVYEWRRGALDWTDNFKN
jgi:NADH:ubiquinone oxidoreductase subunit 3 (subunit A)